MSSDSCCRSRHEPMERLLAVIEPFRWKDGRPFKYFLSNVGEADGHQERKSTHSRRAVSGNDVSITPLHDSGPESMLELGCVDKETARPRLFGFGRKEAERGHETAVGHARCRGKPSEFDEIAMIQDYTPLVTDQLDRGRLPKCNTSSGRVHQHADLSLFADSSGLHFDPGAERSRFGGSGGNIRNADVGEPIWRTLAVCRHAADVFSPRLNGVVRKRVARAFLKLPSKYARIKTLRQKYIGDMKLHVHKFCRPHSLLPS